MWQSLTLMHSRLSTAESPAADEAAASPGAASAPAAEGSRDVHLFAGAQKRVLSVAFEVLLSAQ